MRFNEVFKEKTVTAIQLFSSGWCNLNCRYCFIPKTDMLKDIHQKIIERIKDGSFLKELKELIGDDLEHLAHWGTEPTLTLPFFKQFYKEAVELFPNLKSLSMSSNFMTPPKNIIDFVNDTLPKTRKLDVNFQISLDGPPWITDNNRLGGSTDKMVNNIEEILKNVEDYHNLSFHLKSTISKEIVKKMNDPNIIENYYNFFEDCFEKWIEIIGSRNIKFNRTVDPTLVSPDNYTKEDGINFTRMVQNQFSLGEQGKYKLIDQPLCFYFRRWVDRFPYYKEFYTKPRMFSCSAGDSCFGFGDIPNTIYSCHRSFYINYPEYENIMKKWEKDQHTMSSIENGRNKVLVDTSIANFNNKKQFLKMLYLNRGFQDFIIHRNTIRMASIIELARCGQISPIYNNLDHAYMLCLFLETGCCQVNNITAGSVMESASLTNLRLFGNGPVELYLKKFLGRDK